MNKLGSGSVSDQLKFGSGQLRVKLTLMGLDMDQVEVGIGRF